MTAKFPLRPYPWQSSSWEVLRGRVTQSRLAHALLLAGVQGLGKRHLALCFAQYLLCEAPQAEGGCGACRSCRLFEAGSHPDFLLLEPEEEGKELTVGQVRGLAAYQALKPHYAEHKVAMLAPADRMNANAANGLLKTLEEPAPATLLLLVTDRPAALLPTVRSRCQTVAIAPPAADADLISWLSKGSGLEAEALAPLLALSGGAPLRALQLAQEGEAARVAVWAGLAKAAQGEVGPSELAPQWQEIGAEKAFGWAYAAICELIRARSAGESATLFPADLSNRLQTLVKSIDLEALFRLLDRTQEAVRRLRGHANAQLLVEEFLIHWAANFARRPQSR